MDNRFILSTLDQVEREKQGLSVLADHIIQCGDCSKKLINVVKIKESDKENTILVNCPYCGGASFKYKVNGEIILNAVGSLVIEDINTDSSNKQSFSSIIHLKRIGL